MRYLRLWLEVLGLSWQYAPGLTIGVFLIEIVSFTANIGYALALRAAINNVVLHEREDAVTAAVIAASAATAMLVLNRIHGLVGLFLIVEKVGYRIEERMLRDITELETIEHLERAEYLDRVAVLRGAPRRIAGSMWVAVRTMFTLAQLTTILVLLGGVDIWLVGLLVLALAPLLCDKRARRIESRAETDTAESFRLQRHLFEAATDAGSGKELKVARVGPDIAQRQGAAMDETIEGRYRARVRAAAFRAIGWFAFIIGFMLALALVVRGAATGSTSIGDVVMVVTFTITLQQTVQTAVGQLTTTMSAGLYIEPFLWLRSFLQSQRENTHGSRKSPERVEDGIRLNQLCFSYPGSDSVVLQGITTYLPAGAVVAVVGEYGSGKSTFVKLLNKFYQPSSGSISVDGVDLAEFDTESWRRSTSAAYQDFGRYPQMTFAEAVGVGEIESMGDSARLNDAVEAADAASFVDRLPNGVSTRLSRAYEGVEPSEGQWQKVALARGSMRRAPLLLTLDEPTASLDAPSERAIIERYIRVARERASHSGAVTVIVSHRLSTVLDADLVLVLDRGQLVEQGTHAELMLTGGTYSELYRLQADAYLRRPQIDPEMTFDPSEEDAEVAKRSGHSRPAARGKTC